MRPHKSLSALLLMAVILAAALALLAGSAAPAAAQQPPPDVCRRQLVQCNYAHHFSGTITWEARLRINEDKALANARVLDDREEITVTVADGAASCTSSERKADGTTYEYGKAVAEGHDSASYNGPGLVTVEFGRGIEGDPDRGTADQPDQDWYQIRFACPVVGGRRLAVDLRTGERTINAIPAEAPALDHNDMEIYPKPDKSKGLVLEGSETYEPPEADPVNGVSGTVTVRWSLKAKPGSVLR